MPVLLIKSRQLKKPTTDEGDELSTHEKLKGILEERVKEATNERDRDCALRELKKFTTCKHELSNLRPSC
jgi:hypothetical protein